MPQVNAGGASARAALGTSVRLSRGRRALLLELSRLGRKAELDDLASTGGGANRAVSLLQAMRKQGLVALQEASGTGRSGHHRSVRAIEITDLGRVALARSLADAARSEREPARAHMPTMAPFDVVEQTTQDIMAAKVQHDANALADLADAVAVAVDTLADFDANLAGDVAQGVAVCDVCGLATDHQHPEEFDEPIDGVPGVHPTAADYADVPEPDAWLGTPAPDPSWADAQVTYGNWPVLSNLRQRMARQQRLASLLREAAELADDEGLGVTLLEHADTIPGLSDIELEYLRFADAAAGRPTRPDAAGGGA